MAKKKKEVGNKGKNQAEPVMASRGEVIQPYGQLVKMHLGVEHGTLRGQHQVSQRHSGGHNHSPRPL